MEGVWGTVWLWDLLTIIPCAPILRVLVSQKEKGGGTWLWLKALQRCKAGWEILVPTPETSSVSHIGTFVTSTAVRLEWVPLLLGRLKHQCCVGNTGSSWSPASGIPHPQTLPLLNGWDLATSVQWSSSQAASTSTKAQNWRSQALGVSYVFSFSEVSISPWVPEGSSWSLHF